MGLIVSKIWSNFVSPWITCHQALKSTITKLPSVKEMPFHSPHYLHFGSLYLFTQEWACITSIIYCFMKIKTLTKRKLKATPEEQCEELQQNLIFHTEPRQINDYAEDDNLRDDHQMESPRCLRGIKMACPKRQPPSDKEREYGCQDVRMQDDNSQCKIIVQASPGSVDRHELRSTTAQLNGVQTSGIKTLTIKSVVSAKCLAVRKRTKLPGAYEIKAIDIQGDGEDQVDSAAVFVKREDKILVALLFRSESEWIQLCYSDKKIIPKLLPNIEKYDEGHLFILCPEEQNRCRLQCAKNEKVYLKVQEKVGHQPIVLEEGGSEFIFL